MIRLALYGFSFFSICCTEEAWNTWRVIITLTFRAATDQLPNHHQQPATMYKKTLTHHLTLRPF